MELDQALAATREDRDAVGTSAELREWRERLVGTGRCEQRRHGLIDRPH
jgi:hypothetical protein